MAAVKNVPPPPAHTLEIPSAWGQPFQDGGARREVAQGTRIEAQPGGQGFPSGPAEDQKFCQAGPPLTQHDSLLEQRVEFDGRRKSAGETFLPVAITRISLSSPE
jgi:hypothetical protein